MINPYGVLGVSPSATDEEIKKAYRALSRKYHPDANINNPNKMQAEEKFKEVQQAYEQIMRERQQGGYRQGGYQVYYTLDAKTGEILHYGGHRVGDGIPMPEDGQAPEE